MSSIVYVSFSDSSETTITSRFNGPQDPDNVANYGTVTTSDPRWRAFYDVMNGPWGAGVVGFPEPTTD